MSAPTEISTASLPTYLDHFAPLIGDRRTATTFREIIAGILAAGSLVAARIAAKSPRLAQAKDAPSASCALPTGRRPNARTSMPPTWSANSPNAGAPACAKPPPARISG